MSEPAGPRTFREKYGFVLTPRWLGLIGFAIVASAVCVFLGQWQWDRYEEKAGRLARMDSAWDSPTLTIDRALEGGLAVTEASEWRRIDLAGEYIGEALVRNRPVASRPVYHQVGVFLAERDAGAVAVAVNRGWVYVDDPVPALPGGRQVVEGRLRIDEPATGRPSPVGQVYTYNAGDVVASAGLEAQLEGVPVLQ
ncbi:MAG: SURF1 family protein, partial [bacterium]|nr:SURF1 family protein [bacterium]